LIEDLGKGSFLDGAATTPDATGVFHYAGLNFLGPGLHLHGRHRHRVCGDARVTPVVSTGSFAPSAAGRQFSRLGCMSGSVPGLVILMVAEGHAVGMPVNADQD
jgi:hypothetical protein